MFTVSALELRVPKVPKFDISCVQHKLTHAGKCNLLVVERDLFVDYDK